MSQQKIAAFSKDLFRVMNDRRMSGLNIQFIFS